MSSCHALPILVDLLGEKKFISLLVAMAGKNVYFPSINTLLNMIVAFNIYNEVVSKTDKKNKKGRGKLIDKLSEKYKCDARLLYRKIYNIIN